MILVILFLAQDWAQFRGPEDGQAPGPVATKWADGAANIKWSTPIDGLGWSSPVVADGKIWLTTATDSNRSLRTVCVDAETGKLLWNVEVFRADNPGPAHKKNSYASPTPIADKDRVYVHFGPNGTAALSHEGKVLWKQAYKYNPVHGAGGSPLLIGDNLIFTADGADKPAVVAVDKKTGAFKWTSFRDNAGEPKKFAFCTPAAIGGQVVVPGAGLVTGLDPVSGKVVWTVKYPGGYSVVPKPVTDGSLIFLSTGFDRPSLLAIKVGGKGDVTESHIAWKQDKGAPLDPSPLLVGGELYTVSDQGVASCLDPKTGTIVWQERLGGNFSASPIAAGGVIYFLSEDGVMHLYKADRKPTPLGKNSLKGKTFASPAVAGSSLYLRTDTQLLRIEPEAK